MLSGGWQSRRAQLGINKVLEAASPVIEPVMSGAQSAYNLIPERSATKELIEGGARNLAWGLGKIGEGQSWLSRKAGVHPFIGNTAMESIAELATPMIPLTGIMGALKHGDNLGDVASALNKAKKVGSTVFKTSDEWLSLIHI